MLKFITSHTQLQIKLICNIYFTLLLVTLALSSCSCSSGWLVEASFTDSSSLKPSIILILPQSFRVATNQIQEDSENQDKIKQYIALINNVQNDRDDQLLRPQYKKLSLQVRDAKSPITGQLFYEHVFDYFPLNSKSQHLLVPVDLDQVSPVHEKLQLSTARSYAAALTGSEPTIISRPQQLIVSVRPYELKSGFGSENIEIVSSAPIPVESVPSGDGRRSFAVVQTDKPIYKPTDKVRIRLLVINENFMPVIKDELRLQVRNPHKIIVEEVRFPNSNIDSNRTTQNRINDPLYYDHIFEFPPEPTLGTWSVHLLHNDPIANDTTSFEVREYVLPTYEIEFNSPSYILPGTQNITGSIIAKYHYGKPVQGKAQFKFGYKESSTSKPTYIARSTIKNIDPVTGRVDFKIGSDKFKETLWFPSIAGSRFVVEATVTEMSTGHREIAQDASCTFISQPYKVSFDDTIEDFKPGLAQQLTVQILESQSQRPIASGTRIFAQYQYRDQNGTLIDLAHKNQTTDSKNIFSSEAFTAAAGFATFNFGPVQNDLTTILVTIKLPGRTQSNFDLPRKSAHLVYQNKQVEELKSNDLAIGYHTLVKHESSNGWISLMNKSITHLNVGDNFVSDILIRDAVVIPQKIFYIIVARGQILAIDNLDSQGFVRFTLTENMTPSVRLVLFALTYDSVGLLSDSMKINVGHNLNCGLSLQYKSDTSQDSNTSNISTFIRPNDKGKLNIKGREGDVVSLIGVDSAVYTLNNRTRFESSRIVQRIKRLDAGCGFGGGRNNLDVFHNAGLMFFRDVSNIQNELTTTRYIGSSCLTTASQLKFLEDTQLGYSRPMLTTATQMNRLRSLDLSTAFRQGFSAIFSETTYRSRVKRDVDVETILRRYKDPLYRACCHLGTLEDLPQKRNCSIRKRIVEKYMGQVKCSTIYFDCCRAVFGEQLLLGSMFKSRNQVEPIVETRIIASQQAPQYSESVLPNVGHLDRIEAQTLIRKDFRETWLFELVSVEAASGEASLEVQLPHSITSWSISAIALNKNHPMCFMENNFKLITFRDIFLHLSMPYKVIQGEQIDLVATLFNYSPQSQEVLVYMYGVEDVCSEAEPGERSERRRVRLEKHSSQSLIFPMIPLKIGKYPIRILAITPTSSGSDIVEQELNVVPRGKTVTDETTFSLDPMNHQRRSKRAIQTGNLVDEIDSLKGLQRSKVRLNPSRDPEYIVPQTQECIVSAIGDKLGQTVQTTMIDVESLIRLPHGCGEQVMIYLGPTLYTTRYLSAMNKLTGDIRWRAIRYIQSGYKRILNYRREDGPFSAFPRRDPSIWLTAFIAKMLCQTERTPFIANEIHVDKTVVNLALKWLIEAQNKETGTWIENNPVYHREMLGGVLKENVLTAFVTISLNECAHHAPDLVEEIEINENTEASSAADIRHQQTNGVDKLRAATQKAEQALMLDRYRAVKEKNPYVLALTSYALSFSRPQDAVAVLNDLILFAERSQSRNQLYWRGDYQIETAAYTLQALIELAPIIGPTSTLAIGQHSTWLPGSDAVAIANWLATRRSYTGAFESTQDTVVALEALSKFSQLQSTPNGNGLIPQSSSSQANLLCNVTINNRTRRSIEFGKDNAQVLQTFKLESFEIDNVSGEMLDIITSGNGLGTMSVKLKYNVFQEEDELCRFNIDSSIEEWQPKIILSPNTNDSDQMLKITGTNQTNDTIEDDYFKTFDRSMLSELNLVDLNQLDTFKSQNDQQQHNQPKLANTRKEIIRLRRYAKPMLDMSPKNTSSPTTESWTSRVVSSFKSKLPSWLSSKTTTTTPRPTNENSWASDKTLEFKEVNGPRSRANTSRRSTQTSPVPLVSIPAGISSNAVMNTLSKQLELDQNDTNKLPTNQSQQAAHHMIGHPSHKLVLLIRVCVLHMSSRRDSEMAVIEVGILSGFKPNEADLKEIINDPGTPAMKYEISSDKSMVIFYMQYIPFSGPYCLQFRLIRNTLVYNLQSGYIRVYEYYSPTHSCSNFYTPTRVADLIETKCDASGQVCQCAAKSLCPSTKKLIDLGEIHSVNSTSARNQLVDLVCSDHFDFVALVKLKSVRHLEAAKMFKLSVKVKSDLRGNLTKIMEAQRLQKSQLANSIRKPHSASNVLSDFMNPTTNVLPTPVEVTDEEDNSLDHLNLSIDSSCVRNDPLLLHLAHPNQWKQGGELMILFGRHKNLERRYFKIAPVKLNVGSSRPSLNIPPNNNPVDSGRRLKISGSSKPLDSTNTDGKVPEITFEDAQQLQYSTTMLLDKNTILHDIAYQGKVESREVINNLILWLELRFRREKWTCPSSKTTTKLSPRGEQVASEPKS